MLLLLLQRAGPLMKRDALFVSVLRQYVCVSLSKNGVSPLASVFQLALDVFYVLFNDFRENLKLQLEIFLKDILLNMLELSSRLDLVNSDVLIAKKLFLRLVVVNVAFWKPLLLAKPLNINMNVCPFALLFSSYQHKWMCIVTLSKLAESPQILLDMYLNFDCDEFLTNVFGRMVAAVSK
jgi:brefeldin A-inhibited guanine nucleotide-exchange protein